MSKVTHIFLKDQKLVERLQQAADSEQRAKKVIVVRALERCFAKQEQQDAE